MLLAKSVVATVLDSHSVMVSGTAADDRITIDLVAGLVTGAVGGNLNLNGIEHLTVNGSGAVGGDAIDVIGLGAATAIQTITINANGNVGDTLAVFGTAGPDTLNFTALTAAAGTLTQTSKPTTVTYANFTGTLTVDGGTDGFDVLTVLGTEGADLVTTPSATSVTLIGTVNFTSSIDRLDILTLSGDDFVTLENGIILPVTVDTGAGMDIVDAWSVATTGLTIRGGDGDDIIVGGAFPDLLDGGGGNDDIEGGAGSDTVLAGEGDDSISGGTEADLLFAGPGSDQIAWTTGDGSDLVEGEDGSDLLRFSIDSGSIKVSASSVRVDLTHLDASNNEVTLSIAGTEQLDLVDEISGTGPTTIHDLFGTAVTRVNVDAADGEPDSVTVHGRNVSDELSITAPGGVIIIEGLTYDVAITSSDREDTLRVNGNDGDDTIKAANGVERVIRITLDGGIGNDVLSADATLIGGDGDDTLEGGKGDDLLIGDSGAGDFQTLVGLTVDNTLLRFESTNPAVIVAATPITNLEFGENIVGIDFRPATGQLYGLSDLNRLFVIDPMTGAATLASVLTENGTGNPLVLNGTAFGIDFNPVADLLRVVSDLEQNLRINVDSGSTRVQGNLAYAPLDPNFGADPEVTGAASTNNACVGLTTGPTALYDIDSGLNILVRQNTRTEGILTTVGPLGVDTSTRVGFDIATGSNLAFASLTVTGISGLYVINLSSGTASRLGDIGIGQLVTGLAIVPPDTGNDFYVGGGGSDAIMDVCGNDTILVEGTPGNDTASLILDPTSTHMKVTVNGAATTYVNVFAPSTGVERTLVLGGDGDDTLIVDSRNGLIRFSQGTDYDGGAGTDSLTLQGGEAISDDYAVGPDAAAGMSTIVGDPPALAGNASNTQVANFQNSESVLDVVAGPLTVHATAASNAINYSPASRVGNGLVTVDDFPSIEFSNKSILTIDAGAGDDTINLNNSDTPTALSGTAVSSGDSTEGDTLIVNGTVGTDAITYTPFTSDIATVIGAQPVPVIADTTELVVINGRGGDDELIVVLPNTDSDTALYRVPSTAEIGVRPTDGGSVQVVLQGLANLLPLQFADLGGRGSVTVSDSGGVGDQLVYFADTTDDRFSVSGTGVVALNDFLPVATDGVESLALHGLEGDDTFDVAGPQPYTTITLVGGGPSDADVANLTGSGVGSAAAEVGTGPGQAVVAGDGLGEVTLSGVERINLDAAGVDLAVSTTPSDDRLVVAPLGPDSGTLVANGLSPVVNFSGAATFNVDLLGGSDHLAVHASEHGNTITADGALVTVVDDATAVTREPINFVGVESLAVFGLAGTDTFNVTPSATVPIFVDGGDPIGVLPGDTLNIVAAGGPVAFFAGPEVDEGGFQVGANQPVSFDHIERLGPVGTPGEHCPAVIFGTNGHDSITIIARDSSTHAGADGVQDFTVTVNNGPELLFIDRPELFVDGLSGDDDIVLRTPAPNNAAWNVQVTIVGGTPSAVTGDQGDVFEVETPGSGSETTTYTPTGSDTGRLVIARTADGALVADVTISDQPFTTPADCPPLALPPGLGGNGGIEQLIYDGEAENDRLTVVGTPGSDTIIHTPGLAADAGSIQVNSLLPISYQNLGAGTTVTVNGGGTGGGADNLVYQGTATNDTFSVPGTGTILLNRQLPVNTVAVSTLTLDGLAGHDTFNLSATLPYAATQINGGEPDTSAVLSLSGATGAIALNLAARTVTGYGGTISFVGTAVLNLSAAGAAATLTIIGTATADTLRYTPTGAASGTVTRNGSNLVATFSGVAGAFTLDPAGGSDVVVVNGTAAGETVTVVSGPATSTVQVGSLKPANLVTATTEALRILGVEGGDTFNVTPSATIPIFVDGGDPIGVLPGDTLNLVGAGGLIAFFAGPEVDEGGFLVGANQPVSFDHIETIGPTVPPGPESCPAVIFGTNVHDDITIIARDSSTHVGTDGVQDFTVTVNNGMELLFLDRPALFVDGLSGDDDIVLRTPAPNGAAWDVLATIVGGPPSAITGDQGDVFEVETPGIGSEMVTYTPTGSETGRLVITRISDGSLIADITISDLPFQPSGNCPPLGTPGVGGNGGIEQLIYDGEAENDRVTVIGTADSDTIVHTPGAAVDAGTIQVNSLLPIAYQNLGAGASVTIDGRGEGAAGDTLRFVGTSSNDVITAAPNGSVGLSNPSGTRVPVVSSDIAGMVLEGLEGNDTFNLSATLPYATTQVDGGEPDAGDVLSLSGAAGAIALNLAASSVTGYGGSVGFTGIDLLNLGAAGAAASLTITATATPDTVRYVPTGAASGIVTEDGSPVTNFNGVAGAFTIDPAGGSDTVVVNGTAASETITVVGGATTSTVQVGSLKLVNLPTTTTEALGVFGLQGSDTFNVTASATIPIFVDGGDPIGVLPGDTLNVVGGSLFFPGPEIDEGGIVAGGSQPVSFDHIETIGSVGPPTPNPCPIVILGTNGDDDITIIARDSSTHPAADGVRDFTVTVNGGVEMLFIDQAALVVDALSGDDDIVLRTPAPNNAAWNVSVTVIGGPPSAVTGDQGDVLEVETPGAAAETVVYTPTGSDTGTMVIRNGGLIAILTIQSTPFVPPAGCPALPPGVSTGNGGIETLIYDGEGDNDSLTVTATPGDDTIVYLPGDAVIDATLTRSASEGSLRVNDLLPISFQNLGTVTSASLAVSGAVGTDTLVYAGTLGNDSFAVGPAGSVDLLNSTGRHHRLQQTSVEALTMEGFASDDTFNIDATQPYSNISVHGGDSDTGDVLNLSGATGAIAVDLAANTVTGFGGVVNLSGIEVTNLGAVGSASTLTVSGTPAPDNLIYTPTGSTAGSVTRDGSNLVINFVGVAGTFTLDPIGGSDHVRVNGTAAGETITVLGGSATTTTTVPGLKPVNVPADRTEALSVFAMQGSDTIIVTPSASTAIFVDGGDPIGVLPGDTLSVVGATAFFPGPEPDEGGLVSGANPVVSFDHIERVGPIGPPPPDGGGGGCPIVIFGTGADDDITIIARDSSTHPGTDGVRDFTVSLNNGPEMLFIDQPTLVVDGLSGDDDIVLRAPAPNNAAWNVSVTIIGGTPSAVTGDQGDVFEIETPGAAPETVVYAPTSSETGTISLRNGSGVIANIGLQSTPFIPPAGCPPFQPPVEGGSGGIEEVIYDGEADNDRLTVLTPALANTITFNAGPTVDSASVRVDSLLPFRFQNLGIGSVSLTDAGGGRQDVLVYNGTLANDRFQVAGSTGAVTLNGQLAVATSGVATLVLNGLAGDDSFNIDAPHPYSGIDANGGDPDASDVLTLTGTTGSEGVTLLLESQTIGGFGSGVVRFVGVEDVRLAGGGGTDTLAVDGTSVDDQFTYTPTGAQAGTLRLDGLNTVFSFSAIAGDFTIAGGGTSADELQVLGTNGRDVIGIVAGPSRTVQVNSLKTVRIATSLEVVSVLGRAGDDTFTVTPALGVDPGPSLDNLLILVDGGSPSASDALVVDAPAPNQFVVLSRGRVANAGVVRVFQDAVAMPDVAYSDVEVVQPNAFGSDKDPDTAEPNLMILGADDNEPNDTRANSSYSGSGEVVQVFHASISPNDNEFPGVRQDTDYYRVVAQRTGTLDFQVYFNQYSPALLPGGGDLDIKVLDRAGNVIPAGFGPNDSTTDQGVLGSERVRIPAVAGQTYFVRVFGSSETVLNGYDVSVINEPAPVPYDIELDDLSEDPSYDCAAGVLANSDTGRSHFDNVTCDATPSILFRLDDAALLFDLPGNDRGDTNSSPNNPTDLPAIPIPFRGQTLAAGYRVAVFDEGLPQPPGNRPQTPIGFAQQAAPGVYEFTFPAPLSDGSHMITARVQMIDPSDIATIPTTVTPATGFGNRSVSLEIVVDTIEPPVVQTASNSLNLDLDAASDSGVVGQEHTFRDRITNDTTPTFFGFAEANAIVRLYANGVAIGETVAVPFDGNNQFGQVPVGLAAPNIGRWSLTSNVDLNNSLAGFPLDGLRTIMATFEDLAGNVSPPARLEIFLDTRGPHVSAVSFVAIADGSLTNVFNPKPTFAPTPLTSSIRLDLQDLPARVLSSSQVVGGPFNHPALNTVLAGQPGNYLLVGDANGVIDIASVGMSLTNVADGLATGFITLNFSTPLPDDRYTLTVFDRLKDDAGNALDGDSNAVGPTATPALPSGDGEPGESFAARFTVDSRPEVGTFCCGSWYVDLNGNGIFDPDNKDATNRDIAWHFGLPADFPVVGNWKNSTAGGFDKIGVYGRRLSGFFFELDLNSNGALDGVDQFGPDGNPATISDNGVFPFGSGGRPIAGNWRGVNADHSNNVGLFNGTTWFLDLDGDHVLEAGETIATNFRGRPIVGDWTGTGVDRVGTLQDNVFSLDIDGDFQFDPRVDLAIDSRFGFTTPTQLPVAGDWDADGDTNIGLWVPDRNGQIASETAEWYLDLGAPGAQSPGDGLFQPPPTGLPGLPLVLQDIFYKFGNKAAEPIVGNFDPPPPGTTGASDPAGGDTAPPTSDVTAPQMVDARLYGRPKANPSLGVILKASEALATAQAADPANYTLVAAGKDLQFGTRDDRAIPVRFATYDPADWTVTVTAAKPLPMNQLFKIAVSNNLTDLAGNHIENFVVIVARGVRISYRDTNGSTVKLALSGGGRIELLMVPGSPGPDLRLTDTVPRRSSLTGSVLKPRGARLATATVRSITVGNGVANKLRIGFHVTTIIPDASVVDELLDGTLTPTGLLAEV